MDVLLLLVSEQHVPNLLSVHHFRPNALILVESHDMKDKHAAKNLLAALEAGGLDYGTSHRVQRLESEDSLPAIRAALQEAHAAYPGASWIVNLTGGTKPMSIGAFDYFNRIGAMLVYTNLKEPNDIQIMASGERLTCTHHLSVAEFVAGYGFRISKARQEVEKAENRARGWAACARLMAQSAGPRDFLELGDGPRAAVNKKGLELRPTHCGAPLRDDELKRTVADTFGLSVMEGGLAGKLDKYAVRFLTGGWLEVFMWSLLEAHAHELELWDVRLGLELQELEGDVKNEADVAFVQRSSLSLVECKSGSQDHDEGGDILYKVKAIADHFGARRVRTILVTTASNVLDKAHGAVKPAIKDRARLYGCHIVTASGIQRLARGYDEPKVVKEILAL